jgi:ribosomal protein L40E
VSPARERDTAAVRRALAALGGLLERGAARLRACDSGGITGLPPRIGAATAVPDADPDDVTGYLAALRSGRYRRTTAQHNRPAGVRLVKNAPEVSAGAVVITICHGCAGSRTDPDGTRCRRCRGTGRDPSP